MQLISELLFPSSILILLARVDFSLEASIKGNGAENVAHAAPDSQVSVEHELQALVKTGALPSSSNDHPNSPVGRSLGQQRIDPAALARAATMVEEAEAKARQGEGLKPQIRSEQTVSVPDLAQTANVPPMDDQVGEDTLAGLDLTPRAIAEYLLITGDFGGFEQAMGDLLSAEVVSPKEAANYKDTVGWEYEALLYKLVSAKAASLEEFMESGTPGVKSNSIDGNRPQLAITKPGKAAAMLPPHKLAPSGVDMHNKLRQLRVRALLEKEATLNELIDLINKNPGGQEPMPAMGAQDMMTSSNPSPVTGQKQMAVNNQAVPQHAVQPVDLLKTGVSQSNRRK